MLLDNVPQYVGQQFTIDGIGNESGGTITFGSIPTSGANVTIYRDVSIERDTDYQDNGDLLAKTVNSDFDRIWMALQDGSAGLSRAVRVPRSDINPNMELPAASVRANKALGFDANGNPFAIDLTISSLLSPIVHSIDMLRLVTSLLARDAFVLGYYGPGDGGGGAYYLDPADHSSVDNGVTVIVAADGGRWKLQYLRSISIKQAGARGDGSTNDRLRIQAAADAVLDLSVPDGTFFVDGGTISFRTNATIEADNPNNSVIYRTGDYGDALDRATGIGLRHSGADGWRSGAGLLAVRARHAGVARRGVGCLSPPRQPVLAQRALRRARRRVHADRHLQHARDR